ncbi:hypothetical protein M0R45_002351 [Rubus argutus]|uniref:RNase H type-1 domain-containing protein n=1 Tax=Rubus argutus TaxID=59490 RepID=A0AAW1VJ57_RUBAR
MPIPAPVDQGTPTQSKFWHPPSDEFVKINVDGSWDPLNGDAGSGAIARNHLGIMVAGSSKSFRALSSIQAESQAIADGLLLAKNGNFSKIIISSDSKIAIDAAHSSTIPRNWKMN